MEDTGSQTLPTEYRSNGSRGAGVRARLNRFNPSRNNVPQINIPGMEAVSYTHLTLPTTPYV